MNRQSPSTRAVDLSVDIGFAALLVVSAARYFTHHPLAGHGVIVLVLAIGSGVAYTLAVTGSPGARRRRTGTLVATALWLPLVVMAPSFSWCAFALFFAVHRVLPRRPATVLSCLIVIAVGGGLFLMSRGTDLGLLLGPLLGGLVLSLVYDALDRSLDDGQRLIRELVEARERLAVSEREAGALVERNRMAGELHDTVVQRTASALFLLESAAESDPDLPSPVTDAGTVLRESLSETRQLLHGLSQPREQRASLAVSLRDLIRDHGAELSVVGDELPLDEETTHALLRVAQESLVNVDKHAHATAARVTLTFFGTAVGVDVVDNGSGFDADDLPSTGRGYGMRAMAWRIEHLGGVFSLETSPGHGTTVSGVIPLEPGPTAPATGKNGEEPR